MDRKLVLVFADANGTELSLTYPYVASEIEQADITTLINTIITNGSIFAIVPVTCKSATVYDITPTSYNVD